MIKILPFDETLFSLAPVPLLLISPWSANWKKTFGYIIILLIQIAVFFYLRFPNCYEIQCPEISNNFERRLFYEKYQTLNPDLNEIRGEGFQYQSIFKVLNNLISIFMLVISFSQKGRFVNSINSIFFVKLLISTFEVNTILSNELPKYILKINLKGEYLIWFSLSKLLFQKQFSQVYCSQSEKSAEFTFSLMPTSSRNHQKYRNKNKWQFFIFKEIDNEQKDDILKLCQNLRIEPTDGIFSTKNTYYAIFFISLILLFKN